MGEKRRTGSAPRGDARPRHADLALGLAQETGDIKLSRLLELAVWVDSSVEIVRASRRPSNAILRQTRASRWLRVWAHLAGMDTTVMGSRGHQPNDGSVWVLTQLGVDPGQHPFESEHFIGWSINLGATSARLSQPPRRRLAVHLREAKRLVGLGWLEVSWGEHGRTSPTRTWQHRLPRSKAAAVRFVQEQIRTAVREARNYVRRKTLERDRGATRMRLEDHLAHVLVFLLHDGHGALKGRGWRRVAQAFFDLAAPPPTLARTDDEARLAQAQLQAVRHHYEAAADLVKLARRRPAP